MVVLGGHRGYTQNKQVGPEEDDQPRERLQCALSMGAAKEKERSTVENEVLKRSRFTILAAESS